MDTTLPLEGEILDRQYELRRLLGEGGMGKVYLATQLGMGRDVVVKVMHAHLEQQHPTFRLRFLQEAQAVARLNHPNIVQIFACGETAKGAPYLVMEYVEGRSLKAELAARGRLTEAEAVSVAEQICAALDEAHARGVIHRDLKPENVMLSARHGRTDFVKVLDFGIAKLLDDGKAGKTQTGVVFGTPHYMSPQQARSESVDGRTDLYAVGVMLYEMVSGAVLFDGDSALTIVLKHVTEPAPPLRLRASQASAELEAIVSRCLEKKPSDRFDSAASLRAALLKLGEPTSASSALRVQAAPSEAPAKPKKQRVVLTVTAEGMRQTVEEYEEDEEPAQDAESNDPARALPPWLRAVIGDLYSGLKWLLWLAFMGAIFGYSFHRQTLETVLNRLVRAVSGEPAEVLPIAPPPAEAAPAASEQAVEEEAKPAKKRSRRPAE